MARRALRLLGASHPGPVVGVTAASAAYAASIGRSPEGIALVAVAVLAGQLSVGWHNDVVDAGRDAAAGRLDKPIASGAVTRSSVRLAAVLALLATVPSSLASGWRAGIVHLVAVAAAWAYNAGVKATVASFVPYSVAFGLLPVFVSLGAPGAPLGPWWAPVASSLLGTGAHLMNVLPDIEDDLAAGVRGLPQRLGRSRCLWAAAALLVAASAILAFHAGTPGPVGAAGLALAVAGVGLAAATARREASRAPFGLTLAVALVDVALLLLEGHAAT